MTSFIKDKIFERLEGSDDEKLKKLNKIAAGIMLTNSLSQIYLKLKKNAKWKFSVYRDNDIGYNYDEVGNFLGRLQVDSSNQLQYEYPSSSNTYLYKKPYGCEKSSDCRCEEIFTSILDGSNICDTKIGEISVADTMITFSSLTFLSHVLISTILFKKYLIWIKKDQTNFLRWIEYSITSSIMIFGISGLTGIMRKEELIPLFILTGITNMFGLAIESIKSKKKKYNNVRKLLFLSGIITQGYPWYRILYIFKSSLDKQNQFFDNIEKNLDAGTSVGTGVDAKLREEIKRFKDVQNIIKRATLSLFISYFSFPYIMYKQYFTGAITSKKYYNSEVDYLFASIISKSSLSWQIFGGAFRND